MKYFEKFVSNTDGASGNQSYFSSNGVMTGRIFFKINEGGKAWAEALLPILKSLVM